MRSGDLIVKAFCCVAVTLLRVKEIRVKLRVEPCIAPLYRRVWRFFVFLEVIY